MESSFLSLIDQVRSWLGLSLDELRRTAGVSAEAVAGDEYGKLSNLTSVDAAPMFAGSIYVQNDAVVLVYIGSAAIGELGATEIWDELGAGGLQLASRAGKHAVLHLHAEQGIAYSAQNEMLQFLEVFQPCTPQEYQARIYKKPAPFIR